MGDPTNLPVPAEEDGLAISADVGIWPVNKCTAVGSV